MARSVIKKHEDMEGSEHGPATVGAKKVIASPEEELLASPRGKYSGTKE